MTFKFFPAFFENPTKIRFAQQEDEETIVLLLRRHWITNVPWIFISLLAIFLPLILAIFAPNLSSLIGLDLLSSVPQTIFLAALLLWYLLILAYAIENFLHWYFNIYIVTNIHIVDINFHSLLNREILEAGLDNIESASSRITGSIRSLFNYGDVEIQTAADKQTLTFAAVPYPDLVADKINDLKELRKH